MRDGVLFILFVFMLLLGLFALAYPWTFEKRLNRILMHQPLVMLLFFIAYEFIMPPEINIRVDLLLLFPFFVVVFVVYAIKLWLASRKRAGSFSNTPPG